MTPQTTHSKSRSSRRCLDPVTAAVVVLACCATIVQTAPVQQDDLQQDAWWYNTCDSLSEQHKTTRHAHKDSCTKLGDHVDKETKRMIRTQLKIFMGNFDKYLENINNSYVKVLNGFTKYSQPAMKFLPKFHKPENKSKVLLKNFHEDLQTYAVAVHHLLTVHLTSSSEMRGEWQIRKKLLTNLTNNTKTLLCEVETAVNNTCQTVPPRIPASYARDQGLKQEIGSVTELYLLDWGILKRFHTFMVHTKRALVRNLPQHKGKHTPKPKQKQQNQKQKQKQQNQKQKQKQKRNNSNKKTSKHLKTST